MAMNYSSSDTKYQRNGTDAQPTEIFISLSGCTTSIRSEGNEIKLTLGEALTGFQQVVSTPQSLSYNTLDLGKFDRFL